MSEPLVFVDSSEIREGTLEEVKKGIGALVEFVEASEPRPLAYRVYLDDGGSRMTVMQIHPDSASMEFHMRVAAPAFRRFVGLITLKRMDVYGKPSDEVLEQLRQKVQMLGDATVVVHELHAGFARFAARVPASRIEVE